MKSDSIQISHVAIKRNMEQNSQLFSLFLCLYIDFRMKMIYLGLTGLLLVEDHLLHLLVKNLMIWIG